MERIEIQIARKFHKVYEKLAPEFGYTTRPETREFDENSSNGKLMIAVCKEVVLEELSKAREEGYEKGVKDGMKGKVFKKVHLTEEYRPFKNRGELEEFLKNTVTNWDEIFKVTEEAEWQKD